MNKERVPTSDANQEQLSYEIVADRVKAYLNDPNKEAPYDLVSRYFSKAGDSSTPTALASEAQKLLFYTKGRLLYPNNFDKDSQFGNPGTIVMELPYFYPLHLNLFSWYVGFSKDAAQNCSPEEKIKLTNKLRDDANMYMLAENDKNRVSKDLSLWLRISPEVVAPKKPSSSWLSKLNPFGKK